MESEESAAERRNQLGQKANDLKILTPNQMLCRLPIILAQLNAINNSEKLEINYCILCTDKKKLTKQLYKIWLTLFKNGNNLYEHWEQ